MDDEHGVDGLGMADEGGGAPSADPARAALKRRLLIGAALAGAFVIGLGGFLLLTGGRGSTADVAQDTLVTVPDVRGMTFERATQDLAKAGLLPGSVDAAVVEASVTASGTVLTQNPLPGTKASREAKVNLVMARGPEVALTSQNEPPQVVETPSAPAAPTPPAATTPAPTEPPATTPSLDTIDPSQLTVRPSPITKFTLLQTDWKTVVEHSDSALQWTSGPVALGGGDKRVILNADGPVGNLVAVYSWGSGTSTDWQFQSIVVSQPGELPYQSILTVPSGTYQFLVKSNSSSVLWTLKVQEKK